MNASRHLSRFGTSVVAALAFAACADSSPTPLDSEPANSVAARRFDGSNVPRARAPLAAIPQPSSAAVAAMKARAKAKGGKPQPLANGSFEMNGGEGTNLLDGWTVVDIGANGSPPVGSWVVQTGESSPVQGFQVSPPTDGTYAGMTEQTGPGTQLLYQDIVVPHGKPVLTFDLQLVNSAEDGYFSPNTLLIDPQFTPNQQFRMDIMDPRAPIEDVGAGVLRKVYQTQPGDPAITPYQTIQASLAEFAGRTVRLRFAVVVNRNNLDAGIDRVIVGKKALRFRAPKSKVVTQAQRPK
jgi:hypothetical protein